MQWKGYAPAHNSWEPQTNIHAPELIKKFYQEELIAIRRATMDTVSEATEPLSMAPHLLIPPSLPSLCYPDGSDSDSYHQNQSVSNDPFVFISAT